MAKPRGIELEGIPDTLRPCRLTGMRNKRNLMSAEPLQDLAVHGRWPVGLEATQPHSHHTLVACLHTPLRSLHRGLRRKAAYMVDDKAHLDAAFLLGGLRSFV